jgi:hypothetical protein
MKHFHDLYQQDDAHMNDYLQILMIGNGTPQQERAVDLSFAFTSKESKNKVVTNLFLTNLGTTLAQHLF